MRFTRFLFFGLLVFLSAGCATRQHYDNNQDMQNANANVAAAAGLNGAFCLIKPADGPVRSGYGMRRHPTKKRQKFHTGIDIAAKRGSDVVAAAPGAVVFSGRRNGYGNTVELDHGNGKSTLYAHMDTIFVSEGQMLARGERIGLVGRSGRTTGPNLHFELISDGRHVNPMSGEGWAEPAFIAARPEQARSPASVKSAPAETIAPSVAALPAGGPTSAASLAPAPVDSREKTAVGLGVSKKKTTARTRKIPTKTAVASTEQKGKKTVFPGSFFLEQFRFEFVAGGAAFIRTARRPATAEATADKARLRQPRGPCRTWFGKAGALYRHGYSQKAQCSRACSHYEIFVLCQGR